jgi:hypothetical protein
MFSSSKDVDQSHQARPQSGIDPVQVDLMNKNTFRA